MQVLPDDEYVLSGHCVQLYELGAPTELVYPAVQLEQPVVEGVA